ncbi:MAG: AAA family ATPase, partial [Chloroflexota bacterium]
MREHRRLVTVLFADVVGCTALAEELDAEDVRALLTRYYALAGQVVGAHGGIIAKLLGDGVLACFGIPAAHGDDAQRALDAALALREGVRTDSALQRLQLRIGVNTGEVLANEDASGEIVGDAVNVASRVASAAGEGEILAADSTHRSAPTITYGDPREIAAKGKSQPVRVWPVGGGATERAASTTPFVGREDELAQLDLVARRAFRDRRPHLVTITAPTGIGKSRLAEEFRDRLTADVWYAHAHCPPYGQMLAFGPLRELLLELLELAVDASPEDVRSRLVAVLGSESTRDAMLIGATVAPEGGLDEQERESVFAAWRSLIVRLASARPLLIVLEDLQYAAESVLDLIEQISRPGVEAPLLVVCLARPELLGRRDSWGGGRRNSLNLALEPLDDRQIALLVARLLEADPPVILRDRIVERAAGNPFFAEELVRSLLDRGPLDLRDVHAVERSLGALPETVQATVLARIDMLPAAERAVLQAAAVVGRSFDPSAVAVICELTAPAIDGAIAGLVERELIARAPDETLAFRSALVRDVAYGMLPRARRARDHALVARCLETTAGARLEELASLIALHYVEATKLRRASTVPIAIEGVDAESTRRSAVAWVSRAARNVAVAGMWSEAIMQLQEGLGVSATDSERISLLTQLGEVSSGGDIGWDSIAEALRLWRAQSDADPAMGARIVVAMLQMLFRSGVSISPDRHPDAATQEHLAAEGLDLARRSGDELLLASALVTHAYLERSRGDRTRETLLAARAEAERAAQVLERRESWMMWSVAHDAWAAIEGDLGDLKRAREIALRRIGKID